MASVDFLLFGIRTVRSFKLIKIVPVQEIDADDSGYYYQRRFLIGSGSNYWLSLQSDSGTDTRHWESLSEVRDNRMDVITMEIGLDTSLALTFSLILTGKV